MSSGFVEPGAFANYDVRSSERKAQPDAKSVDGLHIRKIVFLGTSSALPRPGKRNVSSIAAILSNASTFLIDCGEGTQHQAIRSSSVRLGKVDVILLTHLHGDHSYGIFGLLHSVATQGRTTPLTIVGPVGVKLMVETVFKVSGGFYAYPLQFMELKDNQVTDLGILADGIRVTAIPLAHRVQTFGYMLQEPSKSGALDAKKAKDLGVTGKFLGKLKAGEDVTLDDGKVVRSADCVLPPTAGRKIVILQDTYDASPAYGVADDCDLLIHEATYDNSLREKSIEHGHSTAGMAGEHAAKLRAKMLVLTHFSARYDQADPNKANKKESLPEQTAETKAPAKRQEAGGECLHDEDNTPTEVTIADLVKEAEQACPQLKGQVLAAEDFMSLDAAKGTFVQGLSDLPAPALFA